MLFSNSIALALVVYASQSIAAPASVDATAAQSSPYDHIYNNLEAAGQLTWTNMHGGNVATISKADWDAADHHNSKKRSNLQARGYSQKGGDVQGNTQKFDCYGRGALAQDSQISAFAIQACDALVGLTVPKPLVDALKVWQSPGFADATGTLGYLRFSYQLLTDAPNASPSLCNAALQSFQNFCQDSNAASKGGENSVGSAYKFNVDPTEYDCNC